MANYGFQYKVGDITTRGSQNVAGKFGSFSSNNFVPADAFQGQLVVPQSLIPCEGYASAKNKDGTALGTIYNGNTWYFVAPTNGNSGKRYGDHTGIYAVNNYDVSKATFADQTLNFGANTLGVGLPANTMGDFTELIVGEQYKFASDNFTTQAVVGQYATIAASGKLTPSASEPAAGSGVYFKILRSEPFNEGASFYGTGYVVQVLRTLEAAAG